MLNSYALIITFSRSRLLAQFACGRTFSRALFFRRRRRRFFTSLTNERANENYDYGDIQSLIHTDRQTRAFFAYAHARAI